MDRRRPLLTQKEGRQRERPAGVAPVVHKDHDALAQLFKGLSRPLLERQASGHLSQAKCRAHIVLRRILTGQTHDAQGPCAQPCGHGVPQLADHAGAGAGVHDDDGRWPARAAHPGGFLLMISASRSTASSTCGLIATGTSPSAAEDTSSRSATEVPNPSSLPTASPVAA